MDSKKNITNEIFKKDVASDYTINNPKLVESSLKFEGKETFTGVVKDKNDNIAYYLNGKLHRTDGPAEELWNGSKYWYLYGQWHCENGPAVESSEGYKLWFINGKLHRTDGPAIENWCGRNSWCFNNKIYGDDDDFTNESWIKFVADLM